MRISSLELPLNPPWQHPRTPIRSGTRNCGNSFQILSVLGHGKNFLRNGWNSIGNPHTWKHFLRKIGLQHVSFWTNWTVFFFASLRRTCKCKRHVSPSHNSSARTTSLPRKRNEKTLACLDSLVHLGTSDLARTLRRDSAATASTKRQLQLPPTVSSVVPWKRLTGCASRTPSVDLPFRHVSNFGGDRTILHPPVQNGCLAIPSASHNGQQTHKKNTKPNQSAGCARCSGELPNGCIVFSNYFAMRISAMGRRKCLCASTG